MLLSMNSGWILKKLEFYCPLSFLMYVMIIQLFSGLKKKALDFLNC